MRINLHAYKRHPLLLVNNMSGGTPSVTVSILNDMPDPDSTENLAYPEYGKKPWDTIEAWNKAREAHWRDWEERFAKQRLAWTPLFTVNVHGMTADDLLECLHEAKAACWGEGPDEIIVVHRSVKAPRHAEYSSWVRGYVWQHEKPEIDRYGVQLADDLMIYVGSGPVPVFVADQM
jgi:hypothetical protein